MNYVPYRLSEGLVLEKTGKLLPWFRSLAEITRKGGRPYPEKGKRTKLCWEDEIVFGDIKANIEAMEFGLGVFAINIKNEQKFESVKKEYDAILHLLIDKFGTPTELGKNEYGYPWVRWRWGHICLGLAIAERFVDYVYLSVSNKVVL